MILILQSMYISLYINNNVAAVFMPLDDVILSVDGAATMLA